MADSCSKALCLSVKGSQRGLFRWRQLRLGRTERLRLLQALQNNSSGAAWVRRVKENREKRTNALKTAPSLNMEQTTRFGSYSFPMNCFDVKLLINNNITGNRTFPTGARCGRWYKVIQFASVNTDLTSAPRLKSRHPMVSTFHHKQGWDSPACSGQILGPLIWGHFAFQSVLQILLLLLPFK